MQYTVQYNQKSLIEFNRQNPECKIDVYDAILLNSIDTIIQNWKGLQVIKIRNNCYYWIAYDKILCELPSLNITTKNGLAKRIKRNLIDNGLLKRFVLKDDNSKTFFKITEKGKNLITREVTRTNGTDADDRENPLRNPSTKGTDGRHTNHNTDYYNTEDERISSLPESEILKYIKINYSKEWELWEKNNKIKIKSYKKFELKFETTYKKEIKRIKTIKDVFKRLDEYASNWIINDFEKEENNITEGELRIKPPYLRRIS